MEHQYSELWYFDSIIHTTKIQLISHIQKYAREIFQLFFNKVNGGKNWREIPKPSHVLANKNKIVDRNIHQDFTYSL